MNQVYECVYDPDAKLRMDYFCNDETCQLINEGQIGTSLH